MENRLRARLRRNATFGGVSEPRPSAEPSGGDGTAGGRGRVGGRLGGRGLSRRVVRVLPAALVAVCWLGLVLAATAWTTVLSADFYGQALDRANAYDRVYTEVLPDPTVDDLLADLPVDSSLVTANLRTVLPPSTVRGLTEEQIDGIVRYLRADADDVPFGADLRPILGNVSALANRYLAGELGAGTTYQVESVQEFTAGVVDALDALARGDAPPSLPRTRLTAQETDIVVDTILGRVPEEKRAALAPPLRADLRSGDLGGALTLVAGEVFTGDEKAVAELSAHLVGGSRLDLGVSLSDLRDEPAITAVDRLHDVSAALPYLCVALVAGVLAGLTAVGVRARRSGASPLRAVGIALLASGVVVLGVGFALRAALPNPLASLAEPDSPLPPGASRVLADFGGHAYGDVEGDYLRVTIWIMVVGGVAAGLSLLRSTSTRLDRLSRPKRLAIVVPAVVAVLVGVTWASFPGAVADARQVCNGHARLCDRSYDEVVYAAAHNAMANSEDRFLGPAQDPSIVHQLDLGVRALLVDAVRWSAPEKVEQFLGTLSPDVRAALAPYTRGAVSTRQGTWLCHNLCQLGATDAVAQLRGVGDWMRRNPTEVVTVVVQDEVAATEIAGAVSQAGLADLVATPPDRPDGDWPTLGQMIADGRRLYVFTESQDLPGTFLRNFYRYASDTPFHNTTPADLDNCEAERGGADAPLLLVNHWLTDAAPNRRAALGSNAADAVVKRAKLCQSERGRMPTFVAADFVSTGGLLDAVDALNGVAD
jgi:hypothetical protein